MLPIILNPALTRIGLIGEGDALARRLSLLVAAGVEPVRLTSKSAIEGLSVLFVAGLDAEASTAWASRARTAGVLVNVEDVPELCDFHIPAIVRRGDLLLTVSTRGRSPALARRLREELETQFGPEWKERLEELGDLRDRLRADGLHFGELAERVHAVIDTKGWLS
ncbi:MAG: NAD(P)-dependent oxidoreductase [Rhizomicrobium sp.]|nr:NAD(P)-dependent oxidoreductase [Rhizomicrobium sp.]